MNDTSDNPWISDMGKQLAEARERIEYLRKLVCDVSAGRRMVSYGWDAIGQKMGYWAVDAKANKAISRQCPTAIEALEAQDKEQSQ